MDGIVERFTLEVSESEMREIMFALMARREQLDNAREREFQKISGFNAALYNELCEKVDDVSVLYTKLANMMKGD